MEYLKSYVDRGLITLRRHPLYDLWIANYTALTQYERHWDKVTTTHRGRVIDSNGKTISPCLPKFFNYQEHMQLEELPDIPHDEDFVVYEKLDGSYISITNHPDYNDYIIASRGSFESDHAGWARELVEEHGYEFPEGYTFIFELIHPANRIVVDYENVKDLILLSVFCGEQEIPLFQLEEDRDALMCAVNFVWASEIHTNNLDDLLNANKKNFEGYVVWFESGLRVKVKLDEYVRLHSIITSLTPNKVFDAVKENRIQEVLDVIPDEQFPWLRDLETWIREYYKLILDIGTQCAKDSLAYSTRKEQAQYLLKDSPNPEYAPVAFNVLDDKDPSETVWKILHKKYKNLPLVKELMGKYDEP